jgi:predicted nuclease of predicted toxin-antitoxin system
MGRDSIDEITTSSSMRIKLDEHLGSVRVVTWLRMAGHDVATVREQNLVSAPDVQLIEVCRGEGRCLVTCDRGFGNRLRFNPADYSGIVLLRLSSRSTFEERRVAIDTLISGLEQAEVIGKLWVIQDKRIQEYRPISLEEMDNG